MYLQVFWCNSRQYIDQAWRRWWKICQDGLSAEPEENGRTRAGKPYCMNLKGRISLLELELTGPLPVAIESRMLANEEMLCLSDPKRPVESLNAFGVRVLPPWNWEDKQSPVMMQIWWPASAVLSAHTGRDSSASKRAIATHSQPQSWQQKQTRGPRAQQSHETPRKDLENIQKRPLVKWTKSTKTDYDLFVYSVHVCTHSVHTYTNTHSTSWN